MYDSISRMVFGKALVQSQECLLKYIPPGSNVLIAGGGTGWILEKLTVIPGLNIDYVESSAKMTELSQKRNYHPNNVCFINLPIENFIAQKKYDIILTPFFFDNFNEEKIKMIFGQLNSYCKDDATWLYVDFVYDKNNSPLWQKLLLKLMYFFFRVSSNIETQQLINMNTFFEPSFFKVEEIYHYHYFIKSAVYKKR